jgi:uncharacterized protein
VLGPSSERRRCVTDAGRGSARRGRSADNGLRETALDQQQARPLSFLPGVSERLGHYVCALRDPVEGGRIFYVGKGIGDRVYQHARHAKRVDLTKTKGQLKLDRIQRIHGAAQEVGVEIVRHNLRDEFEAFEVEAAVIDTLRLAGVDLTNLVSGHGAERGWRRLDEIVAAYVAKPAKIRPEDRVLLIRLNRAQWSAAGGDPEELYERTRASWVVAHERRKPEWAFAVFDGIVRAVYRIASWERPPGNDDVTEAGGRWAFRGARDHDMEDFYLWTDVSGYLRPGARNPITYVHCGCAPRA